TWQVFSHKIHVQTGFPGSEPWSQENGHNGKLSFDTLGLEEATLSQENGHNGKLSFDTLELEEATLKLYVEEGPALSLPATYDLTVVIPTRNECDNIMPLLHELQKALDGIRVEIIFVDDSDDATPLLIKDASRALETSLFQVHLEHRQPGPARAGGLATAVVHGMNKSQAEY